jgi:glycosyltransferase involved in cell wall biosynthesis
MNKYLEWGIPDSKFRHIYNSAPAALRELRTAAHPAGVRTVFGFMGSVYPPKGVHVLVDAFGRLPQDQAELHIWGDAPDAYAQPYAAEQRKRGQEIPNLTFEGAYEPGQVLEILRPIDVLVVPSVWWENNPLVIQEAFAAGIPVVAGDIGGMAELVSDDVNGLRFRVGDAADLAEKMRLMLDPERRARHRAAIVPPWSHEEMGAAIEGIYRELVG